MVVLKGAPGAGGGDVLQSGCVQLSSFRHPPEGKMTLAQLGRPITEQVGKTVPLSATEDALAMLLALIFPGCMVWLPFALALGAYFLVMQSNILWQGVAAATVLLATLWPVHHWEDFGRSRIARLMFRYTSLTLAWEAPLDPAKSYLFVAPPHGVLPVGNILVMMAFPLLWGLHMRGLTTSAALRLPIMRQVMTWVGCVDAASATATKLLCHGESVGLCPGGVAEIFDTRNKDDVLYIRQRKGFVKLALRTGTPIVPSYVFGNTKLLRAWYDERGVMKNMSRWAGFGVLAVWGRFGLPILYRRPLFAVTGTPIEVPLTPEPTQQQIDKYHDEVLAALQALFEKHKEAYGWSDRKLVIH